MIIFPDRTWLTKQWLVIGTVTLITAVTAGVIHGLVAIFAEDLDIAAFAGVLWGVTASLMALMALIWVPAAILWFRNLSYVVEEDKIIIRKGVLTKIQQNIPMSMVTDFRLQRTLYDRPLGIGSIQIQTAGQSTTTTGYEGKLAGLADWDELHEDLRRRIRYRPEEPIRPEVADDDVHLILEELREIRQAIDSR